MAGAASTVATGAVGSGDGVAMVPVSATGMGAGSGDGALMVSVAWEADGVAEARVDMVAGGSMVAGSVGAG